MHRDFQDLVYMILLKEVGNSWKAIDERIRKATIGRDVLVAARIREEVSNFVELSVWIDGENGIFVKGFPEPLIYGEFYVHPEHKILCIVEDSGDEKEASI